MNRGLRRTVAALAMAVAVAVGSAAPAMPATAAQPIAEPCPQGAACLYALPGYMGTVQVLRFDSQPAQCVALDEPAWSGINNTAYYLTFYDSPACSGSSHFAALPSGHGDPHFPAPMAAYF